MRRTMAGVGQQPRQEVAGVKVLSHLPGASRAAGGPRDVVLRVAQLAGGVRSAPVRTDRAAAAQYQQRGTPTPVRAQRAYQVANDASRTSLVKPAHNVHQERPCPDHDDIPASRPAILAHSIAGGRHSRRRCPGEDDEVFVGHGVMFTNDVFQGGSDWQRSPTLVRPRASMGSNAPSVQERAHIGAGAAVTTDAPDYALVVGGRGRVVGDVRDRKKMRDTRAE